MFCDKHLASVKHTNPVHALYAPHRQLWKEALARHWKGYFIDAAKGESDII